MQKNVQKLEKNFKRSEPRNSFLLLIFLTLYRIFILHVHLHKVERLIPNNLEDSEIE